MLQVAEVDLSGPTPALPHGRTLLLVRDGTALLGELLHPDPCAAGLEQVTRACAEAFAAALAARRELGAPEDRTARPAHDLSVVVCSRDRPDLLRDCLLALLALDPAPGELLVVDSASRSPGTAETAAALGVRVVRETVPGLDRARDRGWRESSGPLVAYVDDDARVDRHWAGVVARGFFDPAVALVTGIVLPAEVRTRAQRVFERNGGMRHGLQRRVHDRRTAPIGLATERLGVGANMAFRREVLAAVGGFDPHLDVGTASGGGGDLEMFHRVLHAGHTAVYEPDAVVRHLHRRDLRGWWRQMRGNGSGYAAYLEAVALRHPELAGEVRRYRRRWHRQRHGSALVRAVLARDLWEVLELVAEASASRRGRRAYRQDVSSCPEELA